MPNQEDRALVRIKATTAMIRDSKRISMIDLEAWALLTFGIRPRTLATYTMALRQMKLVSWDSKTREFMWVGGET